MKIICRTARQPEQDVCMRLLRKLYTVKLKREKKRVTPAKHTHTHTQTSFFRRFFLFASVSLLLFHSTCNECTSRLFHRHWSKWNTHKKKNNERNHAQTISIGFFFVWNRCGCQHYYYIDCIWCVVWCSLNVVPSNYLYQIHTFRWMNEWMNSIWMNTRSESVTQTHRTYQQQQEKTLHRK